MPQVYTVATNNAFAALDDDSDGEMILAAAATSEQKTTTPAPAAPRNIPVGMPGARTGLPQQLSGSADSRQNPRRPNGTDKPQQQQQRAPRPPRPADRGGVEFEAVEGKPLRQPRTHKITDKPERPDRLSGTGRGREMKKGGGGAHNWGNQGPDFGGPTEWAESALEVVPTTEETGEGAAPAPAPAPAPEQPQIRTYVEYLNTLEDAGLEEKEAVKGQIKLDPGYQLYTKDHGNQQQQQSGKKQAVGGEEEAKKKSLPIQFKYSGGNNSQQQNRNRRGNDDEGRPSRGGFRGGNRESSSEKKAAAAKAAEQQRAIDLADTQAFPTLAAK